jgi:hypothetical protein
MFVDFVDVLFVTGFNGVTKDRKVSVADAAGWSFGSPALWRRNLRACLFSQTEPPFMQGRGQPVRTFRVPIASPTYEL